MKIKYLRALSYVDNLSFINKKAQINRFCIIRKTTIDAYSYISRSCCLNNVIIGKYCSIAKNVNVGLAIHPINFISTSPIFFSPKNATGIKWSKNKAFEDNPRQTFIGNDVWIGSNVTIMGGLKIGNGVIIGANALVTKDIKPYSIVGGVPAILIRKRFDEEIIKKLLDIEWWNLREESIKENIHLFTSGLKTENLAALEHLTATEALDHQ